MVNSVELHSSFFDGIKIKKRSDSRMTRLRRFDSLIFQTVVSCKYSFSNNTLKAKDNSNEQVITWLKLSFIETAVKNVKATSST